MNYMKFCLDGEKKRGMGRGREKWEEGEEEGEMGE